MAMTSKHTHLPTPWIKCCWVLVGFGIQMESRTCYHDSPTCRNSVSYIDTDKHSIKIKRRQASSTSQEINEQFHSRCRVSKIPFTSTSFLVLRSKPGVALPNLRTSLITCILTTPNSQNTRLENPDQMQEEKRAIKSVLSLYPYLKTERH